MITSENYIQDTVSISLGTRVDSLSIEVHANIRVDAPADTLESDSKFVSGESPIVKTDSSANK